MKLTGDERLRLLSKHIRREAAAKRMGEKIRNPKLTWKQYDCRDELARLVGAARQRATEDAPQEED